MKYNQCLALCLVTLVSGQAFALPQHGEYSAHYPEKLRDARKFAEKPNAMKKVGLDELDDVNTNQIQEGASLGFSWSNMLGMLMQMLLGNNGTTSPSKNENDETVPASPWANLLSVGLRVLTAILGGTQQNVDGIDKVDNQSSPMQFISIVMNLLDALKTSFSHRSLTARSLGKRDSVSEAAVASISMLKAYVKSMKTFGSLAKAEEEGQQGCAERDLCEASAECVSSIQGTSSIFCKLGSYATSYLIGRQSGVRFESLYEAGRRGRSGEDCRNLFMDCNAV